MISGIFEKGDLVIPRLSAGDTRKAAGECWPDEMEQCLGRIGVVIYVHTPPLIMVKHDNCIAPNGWRTHELQFVP
jgi:hypothetical protein